MINMFDEARSIKTMMGARGMTQGAIAEKLGVSQPYIANKLRLLNYSDECQKKINEYGLSERHARAILRLHTEADRLLAIERTHERGYTVSECEALVDTLRTERLYTPTDETSSAPKRLKIFMRAVEDAVLSLRSLGVDIEKMTSISGSKTYLTLAINENIKRDNF